MGFQDYLGWILAGLFLLFIILILICSSSTGLSNTDICKEQCSKQGMDYYKYNVGGYQNPACSCIDNVGIIKTIYIG
jgi:hypothetical protein